MTAGERPWQQAELVALLMQAPVAIAIQRGPELVWELANPCYRMLLGGQDLVGKARREVLPDEARTSGILARVIATGEMFEGKELVLKVIRPGRDTLEEALFDFICQPIRDAAGAIDGVITFAFEVTERVRAREALVELNRGLSRSVEARDIFMSVASHELRTPITSMLLQVQSLRKLVARGEPLDDIRDVLATKLELTERQVKRLALLTQNLLEVSRLASDRIDICLAELDLAALTREVTERFARDNEAAGTTVTLELPDPPGALVAQWDAVRLEQVLTNLLTNADKYGASRPIVVRAWRDRGSALVSVRDHGIGIAPADQARIFERFERAVSERHYAGFGMGLWIVRKIVERMGGSVGVVSALDEGATFTVRLPIR